MKSTTTKDEQVTNAVLAEANRLGIVLSSGPRYQSGFLIRSLGAITQVHMTGNEVVVVVRRLPPENVADAIVRFTACPVPLMAKTVLALLVRLRD